MTIIVGVIGAAFLFGLFSVLRPSENAGCTGHCAGCSRDGQGTCEKDGVKP